MKLFFDSNDLVHAKKLRDRRLDWLQELSATDILLAERTEPGFLFAYQHGNEQYRGLVADRPAVRDRPEEREVLLRLDQILRCLEGSEIDIPTPKTWVIDADSPIPDDLTFPLFVRTATSSWKRGGTQGRVKNINELNDEMDLLRRAFGWNATILVREWLQLPAVGKYIFGNVPPEIRVWIVDSEPIAWSFHYSHVVPNPKGFPPKTSELQSITALAKQIGSAFDSRLIAADFVRDRQKRWWFLEAGPGSAAGTAHEGVFKFVAERLRGRKTDLVGDAVGGPL